MDNYVFIDDYLSDNLNNMEYLITWFINRVSLMEVFQQVGDTHYE